MLDKENSSYEEKVVQDRSLMLRGWLKTNTHDEKMLNALIGLLERLDGDERLAIIWLFDQSALNKSPVRSTNISSSSQIYGLTSKERVV
ncbi:MAG: hypothetical protein HY268_33570 [Deltaproteobacteria bacterium]|nr:hypothetical protein [Deltaproteobacteria bacterium]